MLRRILPALVLLACSRGATPDIAPIALTPTEYNNTIRDLLGMPDDPGAWPAPPAVAARLSPAVGSLRGFAGEREAPPWPWVLPDEVGVDGFEGLADGQSPSAYQLEELQRAAVHYGAYTLVSESFFACDDWENLAPDRQESCAWDSLERFTQRAWRRPITDAERRRLRDFWTTNVAAGALDEAVALTAAGVLQAPQFVYRIEVGDETKRERGRVRLTDWEIASRLSYLLWDSLPDAELFAAADAGALRSEKQIREQAERMLADPRARQAVIRFHTQWLGADAIQRITPAQRAFGPDFGLPTAPGLDTTNDQDWPSVLGPLRSSMEAELHLFVEKTLFEGEGTLGALLTDNHGYLSSATEVVYGDGVERLSLPTESWKGSHVSASFGVTNTLTMEAAAFPPDQRAGILTLPAILAIGAHPVHPSPILRGKRILERVTCTEIGAPPPSAEASSPPDAVEVESTNRARTELATSPQPCAECHDLLNPPGFAFEAYDALGRFRTEDNGEPVDTTGSFEVHGERVRFTDAVDLVGQLADLDAVKDCYAQRWTDYGLGYRADATDPDVARILEDFRDDDDVQALLVAIATSEMFRFRSLGGDR